MSYHPTSLGVVVAVAETGSVGEAARRVHLSQPSVSYHLKKMEKAAGGALFRRGASGLIPTAAGEALVEGARRILDEMRETRARVRERVTGESPPVRLSSACFTNYHWLPAVLEEMGGAAVELDVDPGRKPFERLDRGELDIALTTDPPGGRAFESTPLFDDEIVAVVTPGHRLAEFDWLGPEDFSEETVAVFDRSRSDLFVHVLEPAGIQPRRVVDVPVTEALLEMVKGGSVISAMARWVAEPDLEAGTLRSVRIGENGIHRTWHAVVSARRPTPEPAVKLVDTLRAVGPTLVPAIHS